MVFNRKLCVLLHGFFIIDEDDIDSTLSNSIGIVLDVGAPKDLLYAFMDKFVPDTQPVVVVVTGAGTNERKLRLGVSLLEKCSPAVVCGRRPDLVALAEVFNEKQSRTQDGDDSIDDDDDASLTASAKDRSKSYPFLKTRKVRRSPSPHRKLRDLNKVVKILCTSFYSMFLSSVK